MSNRSQPAPLMKKTMGPLSGSPFILISPSFAKKGAEFSDASVSVSSRYTNAVFAAGGLPLILPALKDRRMIARAVARADGVLLTGGNDVQPSLYTRQLPRAVRRTIGPADPLRDWLDLVLIAEALAQQRPILAICRGMQILNVALGGTLLGDIQRQRAGSIQHERSDIPTQGVHEVTLTSGCLLAKMTGRKNVRVNSTHHQAVDRVAPTLRVTAISPDGIIEGLEWAKGDKTALPWMQAVQFHPERLFEKDWNSFELFRNFILACRRARRQRL